MDLPRSRSLWSGSEATQQLNLRTRGLLLPIGCFNRITVGMIRYRDVHAYVGVRELILYALSRVASSMSKLSRGILSPAVCMLVGDLLGIQIVAEAMSLSRVLNSVHSWLRSRTAGVRADDL